MRTLWAFMTAYPRRSAVMLIALLVAGLAEGFSLTTLLPLLSAAIGEEAGSGIGRQVTSWLESAGVDPTIGVMLLIIVCGMVIRSVLLLVANRQVGFTVAHVATSLRLELIEALLASRWDYFLRRPTGALANSVATEAYRAATGFQFGAMVIALFIQVLVYITVALLVSWEATLISFIIGIGFLVILNRLVRSARRAGARQTQLLRSLLAYLTDVLGSVKALKAMARDDAADIILRDHTTQLEKALRREVTSKEALRALQEPMLAALAAAGLYIALVWWQLTLPEVMVLVFVLARALGQLNKLQRQYQQMSAQESAYWALREAAEDARAAAEHTSGTREPTLESGVALRDVRFARGDAPIFRGLDLELPVKSFTVVVGPSGIGKTTLLDLLCGLVEPDAGAVLIDGVAMSEIDRRRWRRMIGYVPQDTILLHDSIVNNVLAGERDLTSAHAETALQQAGAWDFVQALPDGMDTVIGERGGRLSGGQRQRVALARALAHQPRFLVLDEPTSALDPETERRICETLKRLSGELTIIAVSHQSAVVEAADRVYYLSGGTAREQPAARSATN